MTTIEVSRLTGASLRQLQWWDENGVVTPHLTNGVREYDTRAVRDAQIVADLRRKGITRLWQVERILKAIGKRHGIAVIPATTRPDVVAVALASNYLAAAMLALQAPCAVILINVPPIESEVAQ